MIQCMFTALNILCVLPIHLSHFPLIFHKVPQQKLLILLSHCFQRLRKCNRNNYLHNSDSQILFLYSIEIIQPGLLIYSDLLKVSLSLQFDSFLKYTVLPFRNIKKEKKTYKTAMLAFYPANFLKLDWFLLKQLNYKCLKY